MHSVCVTNVSPHDNLSSALQIGIRDFVVPGKNPTVILSFVTFSNLITGIIYISWIIYRLCVIVLRYQAVADNGIRAGKVNCDMHQRLCQEAQVGAYPSVRFYAGTSKTRPTQVSARSMQVFFTMMTESIFLTVCV